MQSPALEGPVFIQSSIFNVPWGSFTSSLKSGIRNPESEARNPRETHTNLDGPTAMKFDHHLHTARHSPDSSIDPRELVARAREIGLDGVVITEHDYQWEEGELAELARLAAPLRVF